MVLAAANGGLTQPASSQRCADRLHIEFKVTQPSTCAADSEASPRPSDVSALPVAGEYTTRASDLCVVAERRSGYAARRPPGHREPPA